MEEGARNLVRATSRQGFGCALKLRIHTVTSAGADGRWKAGRRAEIALDGLHLVISKPEVLHITERLTVFSAANVQHKCVVAVSNHPLQLKVIDESDL